MKIFPAVHYSMGGLWCDYERTAVGRPADRLAAEPADQRPGHLRHRRVRLPVPRRQPPGGQFAGRLHLQRADRRPGHRRHARIARRRRGRRPSRRRSTTMPSASTRPATGPCSDRNGAGENPYLLHQQLGRVMTEAATVVRHNADLDRAYAEVCELQARAARCRLSDTGNWTNQNVVFTRALLDMFPLARTILKGARARDECRGAHYKPEFAMPSLEATDPAERRREAEAWCDRFEENNRKWLKIDDRRPGRRRRAAVELPGRGHLAPPAPAAALRPGRRRVDRTSHGRNAKAARGQTSRAGVSPVGNHAVGWDKRQPVPP